MKKAAALFFSVALLLVVLWQNREAQKLPKASVPVKVSADQRQSAVEIQYIASNDRTSADTEQNSTIGDAPIADAHVAAAETHQSVETVDARKNYRIALKGLTKKTTSDAAGYYVLDGTVDGSKFTLKVPKNSLDGISAPLMLEVTDLANGSIQSVPFSFADTLKDISKTHIVDFYTQRPGDYVYHEEKVRLPGE